MSYRSGASAPTSASAEASVDCAWANSGPTR